ncbi:MAG: hypothetical protein ABI665_18340 [Vicinamibacterales bacterium]
MLRRLLPLTLVCTVLFAAGARATTVIPPTFDQLVAGARLIFVGEVVSQRAIWQPTPRGRSIVTIVTFRVDEVWKGSLGNQTQLEFLGGTIGEDRMEVVGMPEFTVGQRDVLFVSDEVRTISPLVGFMHGRLRIVHDPAGVDRVAAYDGRSLASTAQIGAARSPSLLSITPMRLSELESAVRARVTAAGRAR